MAGPSDRPFFGVDPDLLAILGFVLAVILVSQSPILFGVFGVLAFIGWALVRFGVFPETDSESDAEASERRRSSRNRTPDPLKTLQTRYARGEIDEAEFERRLDRILESTEAVRRGGRERTGGPTGSRAPGAGSELEPERGRDAIGSGNFESSAGTEFEPETEADRT